MENGSWIHWPHPSRLKWKAPAFEGKMGVILFTTLTKRGGQAVFRVDTALRQRRKWKVGIWKTPQKHNLKHLSSQNGPFKATYAHGPVHHASHPIMEGIQVKKRRKKKKKHDMWFFKPKDCIDSKLSHPLQDVVSDRPVHTSWALFVPWMWSPSNRSQQLSQWNGKRRIGAESGRGGHCINIASTISPPPQSSCSVPLHTKTPQ